MTEGSLTKAALVEKMADVTDLPKTRAALVVESVLGSIVAALHRGLRRWNSGASAVSDSGAASRTGDATRGRGALRVRGSGGAGRPYSRAASTVVRPSEQHQVTDHDEQAATVWCTTCVGGAWDGDRFPRSRRPPRRARPPAAKRPVFRRSFPRPEHPPDVLPVRSAAGPLARLPVARRCNHGLLYTGEELRHRRRATRRVGPPRAGRDLAAVRCLPPRSRTGGGQPGT